MIDLKDVTFIVPARIEHQNRIENLIIMTDNLLKNFDCKIIVCESDKEEKIPKLRKEIEHIFIKDDNAYFHRTKILNFLLRKSKTDIIVNQDTDVFVPNNNLLESVNYIRSNIRDVVYPYGGVFLDIDRNEVNQVLKTYKPNKRTVLHPNSLGGMFLISKEKYIAAGGENEDFISWGFEDDERYIRFTRLGYKIGRTKNDLFHINHYRDCNGGFSNPFCDHNKNQLNKVKSENISVTIRRLKAKFQEYSENQIKLV